MTSVAIDFGTSNTIVCTLDPVTQTPRTLKFDGISRRFEGTQVNVVPTLAFVQGQNSLLFGEIVRSRRLGFSQPKQYFQAFKRDLVAEYQPPPRQLEGINYSAEIVSELFLKHLWQQLLQQGIEPSRLIFTVPVGAFELYLDWFRDFAERLNVPQVQLIDESTAAALGYAIQQPGSLVLVVDFGGGTLDLSLVRTIAASGGQEVLRAEVLAKSDAYIGGVDIDAWIVEDYLQRINSSRDAVKEIGWLNLLELAERLKINLSYHNEATESWFDDENFIAHDLKLNRDEFAEILEARQLLEQVRQSLDEVLAITLNKGINKADIQYVLLVGGSCLIPAVQQLIVSYFGRSRVKLGKPFEAVAHGALASSLLVQIEDYLRHGYAIRLWEPYEKRHTYFSLFDQGGKYPCQRSEPLTLQVAKDGQREIRLDIGEIAAVSKAEVNYDIHGRMTSSELHQQTDFRSLESHHDAVCIAHLDPPGQLGVDRISVQFEVNQQRVLLATVRDLLTGRVLVEKGAIAKLK
ncbi:Heat shock protein 70 [Crinalium epipsammum PCC 9333]|uniref:Heat shock protein 70 n=1 Tax=Crinalium epipsammum PCC 9333 TaxID=1173022 RepID=K9W0F0_9CYAN|nr:Hsp70 family protein [Crinalium epipsammum]AFZ12890.1 Heat shock protein 70 [Crinalium epipsammum PCC 9333]